MQKTLFIIFFGISSICSGQSLDHKQVDSVLHIYARTNVASADSTLTIMRYLYSQEVVKKDLHLKASIRNELATTLSTLGKRDSACLLYREALNFYSKENDTAGVAMVYNNLAITHYRAGRPDSAMYYRTLDYDFSKATNDSSLIVRSLNGIALLHQYQEQYETMNLANINKEADISNFNIIAEAGGKDLFNWSIVSNANSGQSD